VEIIAENLIKAGWSWGCLSDWLQRANNLDCWRASRRRSTLRCACGWKGDCVCWTQITDSRITPFVKSALA